jgi:hypothetical protein
MVKMLMIMHHIALCTSCIALFNCCHLLHIWVDHAEPESKFQVKQVQWVSEVYKRQVMRMLILL